jgi:hypothetical protein
MMFQFSGWWTPVFLTAIAANSITVLMGDPLEPVKVGRSVLRNAAIRAHLNRISSL